MVVRAATTFAGVGVPANPGLVLRLSAARKALFARICFDGLLRTVVEMRDEMNTNNNKRRSSRVDGRMNENRSQFLETMSKTMSENHS